MHASILNLDQDYLAKRESIFLGPERGLLDTINVQHPELEKLYLKLDDQNWRADEFPYRRCQAELQTASRDDFWMMIRTIVWQWEQDTVAANCFFNIISAFISDWSAYTLYAEIQKNEIVHGRTYSEILRQVLPDNREAFTLALQEKAALMRLEKVSSVLKKVRSISLGVQTGRIERDDPIALQAALLFVASVFCMERVQFMASFGVTFGYGAMGKYIPIVSAVQKICNDELNVHVEAGRVILTNELKIEKGRIAFAAIKSEVEEIIREIVQTELDWNQYNFKDKRSLNGYSQADFDALVYHSAGDVYELFETHGLSNPFPRQKENPLRYMEAWVDINRSQIAPQEMQGGNYLLGGFEADSQGYVMDLKHLV